MMAETSLSLQDCIALLNLEVQLMLLDSVNCDVLSVLNFVNFSIMFFLKSSSFIKVHKIEILQKCMSNLIILYVFQVDCTECIQIWSC